MTRTRNKILAMLVIAVALAAAIITTPRAEADPQPRANCSSFWNTKSASKTVPVGTTDADWRVYVWLNWTNCTNGFEAREYRMKFVPTNPGHCYAIDEWRANPNLIGGYNPGTRHINCDGNDSRSATWNLWQTYVPNGSDASDRCLGAKVTVGIIGKADQTFAVPSLCLPLS